MFEYCLAKDMVTNVFAKALSKELHWKIIIMFDLIGLKMFI
jgi:hypothetical protein